MAPINLSTIKRKIAERPDARKVFLLCEGTNTEPEFLEKILTNSEYGGNGALSFVKVEKTGNDAGVTDLPGLISLANQVIENKANHFKKKKDKVLLFFDLDVYASKGKMPEIKKLIEANRSNIVFAYTNPSIELFLLLCTSPSSYESIVEPNKAEILRNDWVASKDGKQRRYVANLFFETAGLDSKRHDSDFAALAKSIQCGVNQENLYISQKLANPEKHLISNVGSILAKLKENRIDAIEYLLAIE